MVLAEDVIHIYQQLMEKNIRVWLTGGWGIDALLGKQTRPHKDLDVIMLLDDVRRLCRLLEGCGYCLKELWSENKWEVGVGGNGIATAFVLHDSEGRELDAHAMRIDDHGNGIPAWNNPEGLIFTREDLNGEGAIKGLPVGCITAEMQVKCHTGYALPDYQVSDMELLRVRFGLDNR